MSYLSPESDTEALVVAKATPIAGGSRSTKQKTTFGIVTFFVSLFYFFSASQGSFKFQSINPHSTELVNSYNGAMIEGFLRGQLHLPFEVAPAVSLLQDPYDPKMRLGHDYLWDASLFDGKYYLYFGALPGLIVHLPIRLVFGVYPNDHLVIALLSIASYLVFVSLVMGIHRYYFVDISSYIWLWWIVVAFGCSLSLLLGGGIYVISCVTALLFLGLAMIYLLETLRTQEARPYAILSGSLILAVAARPSMMIPAVVMLAGVFFYLGWRRFRFHLRALVPFALGFAVLLAYNFARFGDLFEFGIRYQLGLTNMQSAQMCSLFSGDIHHRLLTQIWYSLFSPPVLSETFPFVSFVKITPTWLCMPQKFIGNDSVSGIFWSSPLIVLGLPLFCLLRKRMPKELGYFGVICLLAGVVSFLFLGSCKIAGGRYALDYQGLWLVVAIIGIWTGLRQEWGAIKKFFLHWLLGIGLIITLSIGFLGLFDGYYLKWWHISGNLKRQLAYFID